MNDQASVVFVQERISNVMVLRPKGQINTASAPQLQEVLSAALKEADGRIVLNCAELTIITSAGLRVLLLVGKQLTGKPGGLVLCELPVAVKEIFDISGFTALFKIHEKEADAVTAAAA